ncbi:DUF4430 domain-containing protein, partial [Candidatus Parcubacteria bacterium]|nr:DUF4430 domain-containing protein [Candidatus Parcubacteria bacterium]
MSEKLIKKRNSWKYKSFFLILTLIFSVSIAFLLKTDIIPVGNEKNNIIEDSEEKISVSLKIISNKDEKSYELNNILKESTVFDVLKNNADIKYNNNYNFGVFIESINGIKNGEEEKYWQYYINNVLGDVAADKKTLEDKNSIEWRFEEVPF